jgi:hypothetical protein
MLTQISFPQGQNPPHPPTVTVEKILIPTTVTTEATIQAEIYRQLMDRGIRSVLEFRIDDCRFDIAVVNPDNHLVAIIECKNYRTEGKDFNTNTKQYGKYSKYGVPVIGCVRQDDIAGVVLRISNLLNPEALDVDRLYEAFPDLVNQDFKKWYLNAFWNLGGSKVAALAESARKGNNPRALFSYLIKQEMVK